MQISDIDMRCFINLKNIRNTGSIEIETNFEHAYSIIYLSNGTYNVYSDGLLVAIVTYKCIVSNDLTIEGIWGANLSEAAWKIDGSILRVNLSDGSIIVNNEASSTIYKSGGILEFIGAFFLSMGKHKKYKPSQVGVAFEKKEQSLLYLIGLTLNICLS
ncbi:hypothetical protein ACVFI8_15560 [Agarivorans sp. MS3-6]